MDGREIEPQWLLDAAETYDPNTYTAVIWIDHFRFYGNMGKVVELKVEQDGDIVRLFARLQPNEWLLSQNKNKQKLFTSMELTPNFAKSGKCYLTGLAVTDIPASLGTTELHFSHRKQTPDEMFVPGVELDDLQDGLSEADPPKWFTKAMQRIGINLHQGATPKPDEDDTMNEQQFNKVMGKLDEQSQRMDALDMKFAALAPEQEDGGKTADPASGPDNGQQDFSAQIAEAMKPFDEKLDGFKAEFTTKVDDLTKRFEQAKPGTEVPENNQPAGIAGLV